MRPLTNPNKDKHAREYRIWVKEFKITYASGLLIEPKRVIRFNEGILFMKPVNWQRRRGSFSREAPAGTVDSWVGTRLLEI